MTTLKTTHLQQEKIVLTIVLAELLLGGSGRVLAFGPLSIRILILIGLLCYEVLLLFKNKIIAKQSNLLLICILLDFAVMLIYSIPNNDIPSAIDTFSGYIVIAVCPVFVYLFGENGELLNSARKVLYFCTILLSLITYALWSISLFLRIGGLLNTLQYGGLAYIGSIPRLFLKGSIFICCALFFSVSDFILLRKAKYLLLSIMYTLAIIMTFTTSFYVFTALIVLFILYILIGKQHFVRFLVGGIIIGAVGLLVIYKLGIINVFIERFSGDYNFSYKGIQLLTILENVLQRPVFGHGFGYIIKVDYGYIVKNIYSFEVMWAQLLLDTGIVGTVLFVSHVMLTLHKLHNKFKLTGASVFLAFELSVIMICLVSFTNPFMNNAIGLMFYAICVGIAEIDIEKLIHIEGGVLQNG